MDNETQLFVKDDTGEGYVEFQSPTFAERLPEAHRENEMFTGDEGIKDLSGLAETHVNTVKELTDLKSAQPIIPESYTAPQVPEGINVDEQGLKDFSALAKEIGLTQAGFDKAIAFDLARTERYMKSAGDSHDAAVLAAETKLKEKWGTGYDANKEQASAGFRKVLKSFEDGDEIEKSLKATGLLDNPEFMRMFRRIGQVTGEDVFVRGSQSPGDEGIKKGADGKPILTYDKSDMPGDARK